MKNGMNSMKNWKRNFRTFLDFQGIRLFVDPKVNRLIQQDVQWVQEGMKHLYLDEKNNNRGMNFVLKITC